MTPPRGDAAPTPNVAAAPFAVTVTGKGPAMLFIPGLTSGGAVWNEIVAAFADRYECHVFTLAGFAGQAPVVADSTWLVRMRDAIIAYAREKRLDRPVLVGHSLGGFLALDIAATVPSLPRAVINVDGLPFTPGAMIPAATLESARPMAMQMRQMMRAGAGAGADGAQMQEMQLRAMVRDSTKLPMVRDMMRASDGATVAEAVYGLWTADLRPRLGQITAPVLDVHAWVAYRPMGQTRAGLDRLLAGQYATLRTGTTRVSDTAHHFIMLDEPAWLIGEMRAFLGAR
jgi:pimeloyl-ACP methyl ester carboxylesterase